MKTKEVKKKPSLEDLIKDLHMKYEVDVLLLRYKKSCYLSRGGTTEIVSSLPITAQTLTMAGEVYIALKNQGNRQEVIREYDIRTRETSFMEGGKKVPRKNIDVLFYGKVFASFFGVFAKENSQKAIYYARESLLKEIPIFPKRCVADTGLERALKRLSANKSCISGRPL